MYNLQSPSSRAYQGMLCYKRVPWQMNLRNTKFNIVKLIFYCRNSIGNIFDKYICYNSKKGYSMYVSIFKI